MFECAKVELSNASAGVIAAPAHAFQDSHLRREQRAPGARAVGRAVQALCGGYLRRDLRRGRRRGDAAAGGGAGAGGAPAQLGGGGRTTRPACWQKN